MMYSFHNQMGKMLGHLDAWIAKAITSATERSFDPDVFMSLRLAPDQFAFARQVQIACDTAKFTVSRLTGKDAPSQPDTETTMEDLRARVRTTIEYLDSMSSADYDGAAERLIGTPRWKGQVMLGSDYLMEYAIPNVYFHHTTAYAILRHNGVNVGKRDFLGAQTRRDP
jgi:hypothetical protein